MARLPQVGQGRGGVGAHMAKGTRGAFWVQAQSIHTHQLPSLWALTLTQAAVARCRRAPLSVRASMTVKDADAGVEFPLAQRFW